jgi:HD-GYP domain-containing protein (c-di-GMP phosphodiesterase class II)
LPIVLYHHERWDGEGYPSRRSGTEVPLEARILAVVDSYDAMTSDRPYRAALSPELAVDEIARCAGTQFDPDVAAAFLAAWESGALGLPAALRAAV